MTKIISAVLLGLPLLFGGCAIDTVRVGQANVPTEEWAQVEPSVRNVASFEMSCAPDQLQLVVVSSRQNQLGSTVYDSPTQVGVTGCGQRRVYTRFYDKWTSGGAATVAAQ